MRQFTRFSWAVMLVFAAIVAGTGYLYVTTPTGFLPTEDQGYFIAAVQLPDAASQERTREVADKVNAILDNMKGVNDYFVIGGFSLLDGSSASNAATIFVRMDDWEHRRTPELQQGALLGEFHRQMGEIPEAMIFAFPPPSIRGLGQRAGFTLQLEDRAGVGLDQLRDAMGEVMEAASAPTSGVVGLNSTFRPGVPQLNIEVDRVKVKNLDVPLDAVFSTLQAYMGAAYVNDFNKFGRTFQVRIQAQPQFRMEPRDIERLEVRNRAGQMIPIGAVATVERTFGPQIIQRFNLYPTASLQGSPAPGRSSGEALATMERIANEKLPSTMGYDWTDMSYQEKRVGGESVYIFGFAVLLVYLVLAAQYESWIIPFAVILVTPLGLLGAIAACKLRVMDNNIYTQIGIVLIIALSSKNAILIVEYARELRKDGKTILEAAIEGSRLRFRPILMTSFAFILGVAPLVVAQGAGAAGQQALGTAVFGGMIASTVLAVFFVPSFFVVFQYLAEWFSPRSRAVVATPPEKSPPMATVAH